MNYKFIQQTARPHTVESLTEAFKEMGIKPDDSLLVHTSLSSIGWINGGPMAMIEALMQTVDGELGTIVMPAQTSDWSDPSEWEYPAVPESWWKTIRETMPAFDPKRTPCPHMGATADLFRTYPNVMRSNHPQVSFTAWGKDAEYITSHHAIDFGLGEESPLAKMYELDAKVLAIGTDYSSSTAMHLGEYRAPRLPHKKDGAAVMENGQRVWKTIRDIELDESQFNDIGFLLEKEGAVSIHKIGNAKVKLYSVKEAVDQSTAYFKEYRLYGEYRDD